MAACDADPWVRDDSDMVDLAYRRRDGATAPGGRRPMHCTFGTLLLVFQHLRHIRRDQRNVFACPHV